MIDSDDALEWRPRPRPGQTPARPHVARYSDSFEAIEAFTAMGLTPAEYNALPGTPYWTTRKQPLSKCHVVMWYRYHAAIQRLNSGIV